jgi:hypothetical protein
VVGYILFLFLFFKKLLQLSRQQLIVVFPAALAVFVAVFPLNVHKSFYGSFSSTLMWWLVFVLLGMLQHVQANGSDVGAERSGKDRI